jgi:hypothetical protein
MTNSGTDASVICENLNNELREFNTPILRRIKTRKKRRRTVEGRIDNDAGKDQNPRMAGVGHCSINLKYK